MTKGAKGEINGILENLCHNTMGNPPYRIDQALQAIKKVVEGKKRGRGYYPATLGGGYEKAGYNQAIDDIAQLFEVMK